MAASSPRASARKAGTSSSAPCPASRSAPRPWSSSSTTRDFSSPSARSPLMPKPTSCSMDAGRQTLAALLPRLEGVEPWSPEALEACVRAYAEETGLKLGKVAQPLRAALTGKATSPGIFDVLDVLGREESLARLRDQSVANENLLKIYAGTMLHCVTFTCDLCRSAKKGYAKRGTAGRMHPQSRVAISFPSYGVLRRSVQMSVAEIHKPVPAEGDLGRGEWPPRLADPHGHARPDVVDITHALPGHRLLHLRPGLHLDGELRVEDHLHRRRQGRSCSIAAIPSISSPRTAPSSRPATCCSMASCRRRSSTRLVHAQASSHATPWCTSR